MTKRGTSSGIVSDDRRLVGRLVRVVREGRGQTRRELAQAAELSEDMVAKIEQGAKAPSAEKLAAICEALDIRPEDVRGMVRRARPDALADPDFEYRAFDHLTDWRPRYAEQEWIPHPSKEGEWLEVDLKVPRANVDDAIDNEPELQSGDIAGILRAVATLEKHELELLLDVIQAYLGRYDTPRRTAGIKED